MQWKINDTVICLWMGKTLWQKPYRVIFRSPLLKLHYYHNKRIQVKESQVPYQPTIEPLPQYRVARILICNFNHQLRRLLAAKFFNSSTQWRSRRCLVTKPKGAHTQQLLHKNDELGQELRLWLQIAWIEFSQCLCNLSTCWQPSK